jgi:hypothetical protein
MLKANTLAVSSFLFLMSAAPCAADAAVMLGKEGAAATASVYGYEVNMTSVTDAESEARRYCAGRGPGCQPFVVFGGFCFALFDAKFPDGSGRILMNPKPVPRELLYDLDRERPTRQRLLDAVRQQPLQALLDEAEQEQGAKCVSSGARCTLKARDCDVTTRSGRGSWSDSRQQGQSPGPVPSPAVRSKECERYPALCP